MADVSIAHGQSHIITVVIGKQRHIDSKKRRIEHTVWDDLRDDLSVPIYSPTDFSFL